MATDSSRPLGAIACGHPVTAAAAAAILRAGGNAFDAIIAAQFAACVAEPVLTSLGGGGFLLAQPKARAPVLYDFFVQTPCVRAATPDFHPIRADFGTATQEFHVGLGAVATPGTVKGMFAIHEDLASMPMPELVKPAVRAARQGVVINELQAYIFQLVAPIYAASIDARQWLAKTEVGRRHTQLQLGDTLEHLANQGSRLFYEGEWAQRITSLCRGGGHLTLDDLAGYRVERRQPFALQYRDVALLTNPPPSSGGILAGFALALLDDDDVGALEFGTIEHVSLLANAMRESNEARVRVLAESGSATTLDATLLGIYRDRLAQRAEFKRGTTHISIVDAQGNLAAMTLSNGEGCGHFIPGTGIMLNNMLGEEDINPDGFNRWHADQRMTSMMAPTLLQFTDGRRIALGSGGSNRIRTALLQVVSNLVDFGDAPQASVERPRLHVEGNRLSIEPGYSEECMRALDGPFTVERWDARNLYFGGVHLVSHSGEGFSTAGDPRRGGVGRVIRSESA
ncbi:MAG: gamma-glutamyltransferase [Gammaproteobacteria bacterium]|nr:gamma-glutamyltransferase [Gammaproteobacteria bacterium]